QGSGAARCHARGALPDPVCTPGAFNPAVTAATLAQTVCRAGWTATIRPPVSYTEALKRQQMAAYGLTAPIGTRVEDHVVPLEAGGDPTSPANLWPEDRRESLVKDQAEAAVNRAICQGRVSLVDGQRLMATDWTAAYRRFVGPLPATEALATAPGTTP
ncbi:MAG: hypothetical protein M3N98_01165, partial [Actinomycetota bacterium]|nr:hypothetical protein [Actinomycetota bacterium]